MTKDNKMIETTFKYKCFSVDEESGEKKDIFIPIKGENLIKPEDLSKHVGEVLMFHNGRGYIVSGVLEEAEMMPALDFSFGKKYKSIEYTHELDMSWYFDKQEMSEYETISYAYHVVNLNIIRDEIMHNIEFIAIPTKEELEFREQILSMDPASLKERYLKLKEKYDPNN